MLALEQVAKQVGLTSHREAKAGMLSFRQKTKLMGLILGFFVFTASGTLSAADAPVDAFYGVFEGETTFLTATGAKKRGISVSISPVPDALPGVTGVEVSWTTLSKRSNGKAKSKTHDAVFVPADPAETVFVAVRFSGAAEDIAKLESNEAEKPDAPVTAPQRSPGDPRGTAPYLWGRIKGDTFSIYVVVVTEDGGYEIQVYDRTLTKEGMTLVYSRNRAGEHLKLLEAFLTLKEG